MNLAQSVEQTVSQQMKEKTNDEFQFEYDSSKEESLTRANSALKRLSISRKTPIFKIVTVEPTIREFPLLSYPKIPVRETKSNERVQSANENETHEA